MTPLFSFSKRHAECHPSMRRLVKRAPWCLVVVGASSRPCSPCFHSHSSRSRRFVVLRLGAMLRSDPEQALPSERRPRRCEDDNAVAWTGHARLLADANPPGSGVLASGGAQAATLGAAPCPGSYASPVTHR